MHKNSAKKRCSLLKTVICVLLAASMMTALCGCGGSGDDNTIKIGYFPNLTHAQAIYGNAENTYADAFGSVEVKWLSFNSGPTEIEAIFAGEVNVGYIGPIPAINGYVKSDGDVIIIGGATQNGALFVTKPGLVLDDISQLSGLTVAVPQFGNTQHLCLLNLLSENGLAASDKGGSVRIIESSNPDTKTLMDKGDIDAALVPEPWATRLVNEIGANIFLGSDEIWDGGDYCVALIVADRDFYQNHPDKVETFLRTHVEMTQEILADPEVSMTKINDKIGELTQNKLASSVLETSFANVKISYDPGVESIRRFMDIYESEGFTSGISDREAIFDFTILNKVLSEMGLETVKTN